MSRISNPVFRSVEREQQQYVASGATYTGITIKTGLLLLIAVVSGVFASSLLMSDDPNKLNALVTILGVSGFVAFISVLLASLIPRVVAPFSILYALAEGFMLGTITAIANLYIPGVGLMAVIATTVVFSVVLVLYSLRIVRASNRLRRFLMVSLLSMIFISIIFALINLIAGPNNPVAQFFANPTVAILLSLFFVVYGAIMLIINFDNATKIVEYGADKRMEWTVSLGLMVTIVWIYIEILRLLVIILGSNRD